jgi:hypothetical protein
VFFGFGRADRKRPTRERYEEEAALLLASRIAEGRPPPEVWRKAEEWRAKHAQANGWYLSATPEPGPESEAGRPVPFEPTPLERSSIGQPFVLRSVRLPVAGEVPAPAPRGSRLKPRPAIATD